MTALVAGPALDAYAAVFAGLPCRRIDDDGHHVQLPVRQWHGRAERALRRLIDRCTGSALDVGCGPGRLSAELSARGIPALGIDTSSAAVRLARERGAVALRRSVFDALPDEGGWRHILLADGNIGISGDPVALLCRCASLLRRGGTILAEVDQPGTGLWRGRARLRHQLGESTPFAWARVGLDAVPALATQSRLAVRGILAYDGRWFTELAPV
jgi:SAM-dependent methyltransferase